MEDSTQYDDDYVCLIMIFVFIIILALLFANLLIKSPYEGGVDNTLARKIQREIFKDYPEYRASLTKQTFDDFCFPKSFRVQKQQAFVSEYLDPINTDGPREMLIFHKIGAGKTCLAIQTAERWLDRGKPLILMPASLIPGFRAELRGPCGSHKYITKDKVSELVQYEPQSREYRKIIEDSNKLVDKKYQIMSYNKFLTAWKSLKTPILIVDEVQNINNQRGSYFNAIYGFIKAHPSVVVVLMSGTPIFDNPDELNGLLKLMRLSTDNIDVSPEIIYKKLNGRISYYPGAPSYTFPKTNVYVERCVMSAFQTRWYRSQIEVEEKRDKKQEHVIDNNFYIKSRQRANVVFPKGLVGNAGLRALTHNHIKDNLHTYSIKFAKIINRLKSGQLSFVYTSFAGSNGIDAFIKCLNAFGYSDYYTNGPGKRRYAIWSGDETRNYKDIIRETFNSHDNDDGKRLQIIIGSPAIKEGVSLFRVRQVHVIEPYWNHSRLAQIYGRAVRYCSHKSLQRSERSVDIYIYCAVASNARKLSTDPNDSVDNYMLEMADKKRDEMEPFIHALMDVSVDKKLHRLTK